MIAAPPSRAPVARPARRATSRPPPFRRNLRAAAAAIVLTLLALVGASRESARLLERYIHALAPGEFTLKGQAMAMQRAAFAQPDLLPLYGSSELVRPIPTRASVFFANYPTNFAVFPVGRAGCSSIIILQKLAAAGPALRGKKVAISISPGWFLTPALKPKYYHGNFSHMQASELLFSSELSHTLKRDAARRMLEFPRSLEHNPTLKFALELLAEDTLADRCEFALLTPFAKLQNLIQRAQDDFECTLYILEHRSELPLDTPHQPTALDWPALLDKATRRSPAFRRFDERPELNFPSDDDTFRENVTHAHEWGDFELLLRGLRELGAEPLLLSIPMNGPYFDHLGITSATRDLYTQHLRALAAQYEMPLLDFAEHEQDPRFLVDQHDHPSVEGWIYFDQALDAFITTDFRRVADEKAHFLRNILV